MDNERGNPYRGMDVISLRVAALRRDFELVAGGQARTGEERTWLAIDTRHLLRALAAALDTGAAPARDAISLIPGATAFVHDHATRHAQATRVLRLATLDAASEEWLGSAGMVPWYRWHFVGGEPLMDVAMASDAGLQAALQLLVAKPRGRKR